MVTVGIVGTEKMVGQMEAAAEEAGVAVSRAGAVGVVMVAVMVVVALALGLTVVAAVMAVT